MQLIKPLIHPPGFDAESPAGYLIRLAKLNRYDSYRWLFRSEKPLASIPLMNLYQLLCKYSWTGFRQSHVFSNLRGLSYRYVRTPHIMVCPDCIRDKGYWDYKAHVVLNPICVEHNRWRLDRCKSCKKGYSWHHGSVKECECGALREGESEKPSEREIRLAAFIDGVEGGSDAQELNSSEFDYKTRCDFFLFLSRYISGGRRAGEFRRLTQLTDLQECWGTIADIVFGDTDNLNTIMEKVHRRSPTNFKHFYREVQEFNQPSLQWFRDRVIAFVSRDLRTPISRQHRSLFRAKPKTQIWSALQTVSREYGFPKSTLKQLADEGILERQFAGSNKRQQILIYIESRDEFANLIRDYIDFQTCTERLGVTKKQLRSLIEKKCIKGACKPDSQYSKWLIPKSSIDDFKVRLSSRREERDTPSILFREALAHFSKGVDDLLVNLVRAILGGQVTVIASRPAEQIRDIAMDREEFLEWRSHQITQTGKLTIVALADRLGIHQEAMYKIVNAGLIETENYGGNSLNRRICESEVERFQSTFVFLSKVAWVSRRSPFGIAMQLESSGVRSVNQMTGLKLRQTMYIRSDVAEYADLREVLTERLDWKLAYGDKRPEKVEE